MRQAFSLVMAIFVILIMATVAALVFNLSGKSAYLTTLQYRQEQAALLAKSYTELAIMAVMQYDRETNGDCIEDINALIQNTVIGNPLPAGVTEANGGAFKVEVQIFYIGNNMNKYCSNPRWLNNTPAESITTNYGTISGHSDALAAVIIDVYVKYVDPNMYAAYVARTGNEPNVNQFPRITYHHRTLQKI